MHCSSIPTQACAVTGCLQCNPIRPVTSAWQSSGAGCCQCGPLSLLACPGEQSLLTSSHPPLASIQQYNASTRRMTSCCTKCILLCAHMQCEVIPSSFRVNNTSSSAVTANLQCYTLSYAGRCSRQLSKQARRTCKPT